MMQCLSRRIIVGKTLLRINVCSKNKNLDLPDSIFPFKRSHQTQNIFRQCEYTTTPQAGLLYNVQILYNQKNCIGNFIKNFGNGQRGDHFRLRDIGVSCRYLSSDKDGDGEVGGKENEETDDDGDAADELGKAEVMRLTEDPELDDKDGEEREVKEMEEFVSKLDLVGDGQGVEASEDEATDLDEGEPDKEDESISVKHQVMDAEGFLRGDFSQVSLTAEKAEDRVPEEMRYGELPLPKMTDNTDDTAIIERGEERRRHQFWEYMENPGKKRYLLKKLLSPSGLDESEEIGIDKSDLVNSDDFFDYLVDVRHSQKAVKTGAIIRYRAMMVSGNMHGIVGFGFGKSSTVQGAIQKSRKLALKNLMAIPVYRGHTIYEAASAKVTKTKVLMWPRSRGFGVRANKVFFKICDLIGIQDISIKVRGSRNEFNMIKAFFAALESTRSALEIAEEKGVYMREKCLFKLPSIM